MVLVLAAAVLGAKTETAYAGDPCSTNELVHYRMTFQGNFNSASSPGGLPHIARFTQIIWVTHTSQKTFWKPGGMASPGVENVAELGETFEINDEIIDEFRAGTVEATDFFPYGRYPRGEETLSRVITLCKKAPLVTFLAMLDFSPDWFIGVSNYSLLNSQSNWISSVTLDLYPYDAGTEEGTEFSLNNPPSKPHVPITSLRGKGKFSGATAPVARMTFERTNTVNLLVNGRSATSMTEGDGALSITAMLTSSNASGGALSIPLVIGRDTTAQSGDYTAPSSISIADGAKSGSGSFAAVDDSTDESSERVVIQFGSSLPGGIAAGYLNLVTITIEDNDAVVVNLGRSDSGAVAEGGTGVKADAEFTVTLSRALATGERIDVPLVLSGSGVTAGDFSLAKKSGGSLNKGVTVSGSDTLTPAVIFQNAGARTATLTLTPTDDSHIESDETLTVALGPDGGGTNGFDRAGLGTNVGGGANPHGSSNSFDVVIESDDTAPPTVPLVSISGGSAVTEGESATFTLTASPAPSSAISVKVTIADNGSFAANGQTGSKKVTIGTGGTASLTVTTVNDSADELDGTIAATLGTGSGYGIGSPNSASVTVRDDDDPTPVITISGGSTLTEGESATFTLTASPAPSSDISVRVMIADSGSFAANGHTGSKKVTIGTGGTASLTVTTANDNADEPDGTITATVEAGTGYSAGSPGSASVTVEDDDDPTPEITISGGNAVTEGGSATFTLTASPAPSSGSVFVKVTVSDSGNFAVSGQTGSTRVTIGTDGTASLTVTTVNDNADELDGTITATVEAGTGYSAGSPGSASVTVEDDDDPTPEVTISGGNAVTEGGSATFTLTASPAPSSGSVFVKVTVSDSGNFAVSGQTGSTRVTIGTDGTASLTVTTVNDNADELDGTITATVEAGTGYSAGSPGSASVTVEDDDDPTPEITISGGLGVTEGKAAKFTVSASPAPAKDITVNLSVSEDSGEGDFVHSGNEGTKTVTIKANKGSASFTVSTLDDKKDEPGGSVTVTLKQGTGYTVGTRLSASVTVSDDDDPPTVTDAVSEDTGTFSGNTDDVTSPDRGALVEIYKASGGARWTRNDNWNSDAPIALWYGVSADSDGRVTELLLEDNNLSGTIDQDIGKLEQLEVLWMNDNSLAGTIPVAELETLGSLEELALWGNAGLGGTITDELGKRVDRAVLRRVKDVNGDSSLQGWFALDETVFDYSGWQGVGVNSEDRVSELDLSASGLRGDITDAVWELSDLERLDVSDNPDLTGELPQRIADTALEYVDISGSGVCAPEEQWFTQWVDDNDIVFTDNDICGQDEGTSSAVSPSHDTSEPTQTTGAGGGCSVASGSGFRQNIPEFALGVFLLGMMLLAGRRNAQHENGIQTKNKKDTC